MNNKEKYGVKLEWCSDKNNKQCKTNFDYEKAVGGAWSWVTVVYFNLIEILSKSEVV